MSASQPQHESPQDQTHRGWYLEWLVIWGMMLAWSFLRIPIPGVNEPHYLTKAKQFWSPEWCANDFFLDSSNPHLVFYAMFGWLTKFLSLYDTVVVSRCVGLLVLAYGWQALTRTLLRSRWLSLGSLAVFMLCHSLGNWSGEWLIGGIESKVLAYGFLFTSISCLLNRELLRAGLLAGAAFSFHPVVGAWGVICMVMVTLIQLLFYVKEDRLVTISDSKKILLAAVCFLVTASPGMFPALQTLSSGDPQTVAKSELLQVASRLKHHLDPMSFPRSDHRFFGVLIFVWCCLLGTRSLLNKDLLESLAKQKKEHKWWNTFVLASLITALCGVALAWGPRPMQEMPGYEWRIKLMKLYPFRLADIIVPIAISTSVISLFSLRTTTFWQRSGMYAVCAAAYVLSIFLPGPDQNPGRMSPKVQQDWIEVCDWIKSNTPADSIVYGINEQWALRWYAQRAEYVNYKDCPQDADGMVEWNDRLWVIHRWKRGCFEDNVVSETELAELHQKTGIDFFMTSRFGPINATPIYRNKTFQIYNLKSISEEF